MALSMPTPPLLWLPLGFHDWLPAAQAATLGLLTFVQEDVPTVSAALVAAAGTLTWKAVLLAAFSAFGSVMHFCTCSRVASGGRCCNVRGRSDFSTPSPSHGASDGSPKKGRGFC